MQDFTASFSTPPDVVSAVRSENGFIGTVFHVRFPPFTMKEFGETYLFGDGRYWIKGIDAKVQFTEHRRLSDTLRNVNAHYFKGLAGDETYRFILWLTDDDTLRGYDYQRCGGEKFAPSDIRIVALS